MKTNGLRLTRKGVLALSLLLLVLIGAIWLNVKLNAGKDEKTDALSPQANIVKTDDTVGTGGENKAGSESKPVNAGVYSNYFANFRDERNVIRSQEIEYLRMIIADETTDAETIRNAQQRLMDLVSNMEKEFSIESIIRSKGFLDAAVTFRNDAVTVVVDGESLTNEEVARILDIVRTETGASASAVRISLSSAS